jgi:hypothetical protein
MAVNMVLLHSGQSFEICAHISLRVLVQGTTKLLLWFSLMDEEYEEIQTTTKVSLSGSFTRVSFAFNSLPHMHF